MPRGRPRLTESQIGPVAELHGQKMRPEEIATRMGLTYGQIIYRLKRAGIEVTKHRATVRATDQVAETG